MSGFIGYMINQPMEFKDKERERFDTMLHTIQHRGPDGKAVYADNFIRLGFQNLHTLTLTHHQQPLSYENDRYWIVFDGVLYNHKELRGQLIEAGYTFETETDTEVLLALYANKQEKALDDLRGMYSFLIWDKQEQRLFGARDPFGIKPFYYTEAAHGFYFASEMKSLYCHEKNMINLEALQHYFSFQYVPEPQTMQKDIYKLKPGYYFYKQPGQVMQMKSFSQLKFTPKQHTLDKQVNKIKARLRDSVSHHMQSEVPVGAFLSGGVDSSAIVALAKEIDPSIKTFTVGFEREGYSEIDIAKETAEQLAVENYHYIVQPKEFIEVLPHIIKHMDDPVADPAAVPLYFAAREAKKQVDVVLSGEGADELFSGYNIYREPNALKAFDYIPNILQTALRKLARVLPEGVRGKSLIERGTTPLENRFIGNAKLFKENEKALLLQNYQQKHHYKKITQPLYDQVPHYSDVHKMQFIDLYTWARGDILVKADRMSMAHGLQLRTPFLDQEVFQIASELLTEQTITKGTTKYALREAMRDIVPDSVLYNRKLGFPVPIRHWLKKELLDWAVKTIEDSHTGHLINKQYVYTLLNKHRFGKQDYSREIWAILVFMIWYEQLFTNNA